MKIYFMPKTRSGKLAVGLGVTLVIVMVVELIFATAIGGDPAVVAGSPLLTILAALLSIMFTLSAPISFFIGIYTIIKHKEWSIWKPLAILYFITLIMFLLGELLFSH